MNKEKLENKDQVPEEFQDAKEYIDDFNYEESKRGLVERLDPDKQRMGSKLAEVIRLYKEGGLKISDIEMWSLFNKVKDYLNNELLRKVSLQEASSRLEAAVDGGMGGRDSKKRIRNLQKAYKKFFTQEELERSAELNMNEGLKWRMIEKIKDRFQKESADGCKKIEDELDKLLEQNKE